MRRMVGSAVVGNVGLSVEVGGRMKKIAGWSDGYGWWGDREISFAESGLPGDLDC